MESNDFSSLAVVHLPPASRLLPSACCPDKDLLVLINRLGGHDRLSLWKIHGAKTWEVDVSTDSERIVDIAWSPDGQSIAVAHDPPSITLHSIQDGHEERVISLSASDVPIRLSRLTSIWWFHQEKPPAAPTPDIFRRNNIITGSAHSILRTLPLLDTLRDSSQHLTATDLFAFQGSQTVARRAAAMPPDIKWWPALQADPVSASIDVTTTNRAAANGIIDEVDNTNDDSILAVADSSGHLACFLDGAYPLGSLHLGTSDTTVTSLFKNPKRQVLLAHPCTHIEDSPVTDLYPTHITLPLLEQRKVRDFAKLSTSARELCWYALRVVEEMRAAWFGTETTTGARELGPKWVRAYERKQREQFGLETSAILDFTMLLVTDRPTDALADFLGSGQQMTERGIQKWDSAVTEALVKLRDFSEQRLNPALQRLHVLVTEVRGWSSVSNQLTAFDIDREEVDQCLVYLTQAIILTSWLAAAARREHGRFKEFMSWLRYEIVILNPANEAPAPLRHDILEVNQYFMSGLEKSAIDNWFMGSVPTFNPQELGIPSYSLDLPATLQQAYQVLEGSDPYAAVQSRFDEKKRDTIERNLTALIAVLAKSCRKIFDRPTGAATRSATVSIGFDSATSQTAAARPASPSNLLVRERTTVDSREDGCYIQFLALHASLSEHRAYLCFARQHHGHGPESSVEVALHEVALRIDNGQVIGVDLLAMEFFDDETIVIVYRSGPEGEACIATMSYSEMGYQEFKPGRDVTLSRETLIVSALHGLQAGQLQSGCLPIKRCRALKASKGALSLAVNARKRVASVLSEHGILETLDLEEGGEEGDTTQDESFASNF